MHVQRLTHIGICVSDLERSLRFYRDAIGCEEVGSIALAGGPSDALNGLEGVKVRAIYLERDGYRLELISFDEPGWVGPQAPRPMNQVGLTHLSLRVDDLDAVCARIEEAGGSLLPDSRVQAPGFPSRAMMACDPDGMRLELVEAPGDPNAVPGSPRYMAAD